MSKVFTGKVIGDKMNKTVVVEVVRVKPHSRYRKVMRKKKKFYAHTEVGVKLGDWVKIQECRPLSKLKRFKVIEVVKK